MELKEPTVDSFNLSHKNAHPKIYWGPFHFTSLNVKVLLNSMVYSELKSEL